MLNWRECNNQRWSAARSAAIWGRNRSQEGEEEENTRSRGEEEVGLRWGGIAVKNGGAGRD